MNFGTKPLAELFHLSTDNFIACSGLSYKSLFANHNQSLATFSSILNSFGILSAKSQGLKQVITAFVKFSGTDQRIYIKINKEENKVLGFLKVGEKNLFYRDYIGNVKELRPTCVLDVYVHESCQRSGIGKEIFQKFLQTENVTPQKLAYDRPSPKLISFLKKHYDLVQFIQQNNNFVIFDKYFTDGLLSKEIGHKKMQGRKHYPNFIPSLQQNLELAPEQPMVIKSKRKSIQDAKITDSLEILEKQVENMKNQKSNLTTQEKALQDLYYRTPWAAKQQKLNFRTTSNIYGSHYLR